MHNAKQKCKCCGTKYEKDSHLEGTDIPVDGITYMGYGSDYDFDKYKFTLVPGWYCYKCLDREIKQGLCQPLITTVRTDDAQGYIRKKHRVKGIPND